jgi:hypothetical protein
LALRGYNIPDDIYFLCILHNVGAVNPEKSLSLEEIVSWTTTKQEYAKDKLRNLLDKDYIQMIIKQGEERYHVNENGIRKVLSMYS